MCAAFTFQWCLHSVFDPNFLGVGGDSLVAFLCRCCSAISRGSTPCMCTLLLSPNVHVDRWVLQPGVTVGLDSGELGAFGKFETNLQSGLFVFLFKFGFCFRFCFGFGFGFGLSINTSKFNSKFLALMKISSQTLLFGDYNSHYPSSPISTTWSPLSHPPCPIM